MLNSTWRSRDCTEDLISGSSGSIIFRWRTVRLIKGKPINAAIYKSSVKKPSVSLILQDRRMIGISGRYFRIDREPDTNGFCRTSVIFSFRAALQEGHYFITVRLEERFSDKQFLLVDKQAGALYFEVTRSDGRFFRNSGYADGVY